MTYLKNLVMKGFKSFPRKTEIPLDKSINVILGPNGSGKCLTGDCLVMLSDGSYERIDTLVNARMKNAYVINDGFIASENGLEIMSLNLKTLKNEIKKIKSFVKRTSPKTLLEIKTRSGRSVKTTKYHPLFILKENRVVEARADELREGVRIAVPRGITIDNQNKYFTDIIGEIVFEDNIYVPYKEEFRQVLYTLKDNKTWKELAQKLEIPYYTLKGLLDKQSINLFYLIKILRHAQLSNNEIIDLLDRLISNGKCTQWNFKNSPEFSRFFGYLLAEGRLAESSQIWFTNGDPEIVKDYIELVRRLFKKEPLVREYKQNYWDVIIFSEPLKKLLRKLGAGSSAGDKFLSNTFLKACSNEEIANLLNGLYSGDGYVSKNSIEITSKSNKLMQGIEICLLRLGILSSTVKVIKSIKATNFFGEYYTNRIYGVENFKKFHNAIDLVHRMKRERIKNYTIKKENPNLDLIEMTPNILKHTTQENSINIKETKKQFPRIDSYVYNQCTPSRSGLQLLQRNLFQQSSESLQKLSLLIQSDIYWDEIIEINEIKGEEWVYDLCIDENHNFIANNIFVHNSNVSDALCFVLGRLSIKSMRAAKASNLIFMGTKAIGPAKEASVELVFDNIDKTFPIEKDELSIERIVRSNGQSIYKIDHEVKTRQEVLEVLAQAGIDPHGFNIVLQGEIQNIVRMNAEERRGIVEEVAGISIYEMRKEKTIKELEKTEEKLKEVNAVLRERTSYLNNLERERQQALHFKELQETLKRCKASIFDHDIKLKEKEIKVILSQIEEKNKDIEKYKSISMDLQTKINDFEAKISKINSLIQQATGIEQEKLNREIADLRAIIAGLKVRQENYQKRLKETEHKRSDLHVIIDNSKKEIKLLEEKSPTIKKSSEEIAKRKKLLEDLEKERKKFYTVKSEIRAIHGRLEDKKKLLSSYENDMHFQLRQIDLLQHELFDKTAKDASQAEKKLAEARKKTDEDKQKLNKVIHEEKEIEREIAQVEFEQQRLKKVKTDIEKLEICPLCKNVITEEHLGKIDSEIAPQLQQLAEKMNACQIKKNTMVKQILQLNESIDQASTEIIKRQSDSAKLIAINDKTSAIKMTQEKTDLLERELAELEKHKIALEKQFEVSSTIEERYEQARIEMQDFALRTEENRDAELSFKRRELERQEVVLKQLSADEETIAEDLAALDSNLVNEEEILQKKIAEEEELSNKFKKFFSERESFQDAINQQESDQLKRQQELKIFEEELNELKIVKARLQAEFENLQTDAQPFASAELLKGSREVLAQRLQRTQEMLDTIGSVNLRALEVYDEVKKEYDAVNERVQVLTKEKDKILNVIHEIDIKKRKTFLRTLEVVNELFSRNFTQLSAKGEVILDIENKKDPFDGGLNILVKVGKGKYFDVTSLSGGEQALVALSLIFAIQEYRPYAFYILDEIDAALDKRNSHRLGILLQKYMTAGQYIVITHNDEIISSASTLYGVSMHDGISKIVSMRLENPEIEKFKQQENQDQQLKREEAIKMESPEKELLADFETVQS